MTVSSIPEAVSQAIELLSDDIRRQFATNPIATMELELDLTVTAVNHLNEERAEGGACDGVSFLKDNVVLYAATGPWNPRQNFTLAHELGHWLIDQADDIYDWLLDQPDATKLLETVCDRIAARLLIPDAALDAVVGAGPIRAHHVIDLFESTQVSRPVAAIALAKRLPNMGAIAIIDRSTGEVTTASVRPDDRQGWPRVFPWPGQRLPDSDPLLRMEPRQNVTVRRPWRTSWDTTANYYIDAFADHSRIIVVFSDTDLWNVDQFHTPSEREYDQRPTLPGNCCGKPFDRTGYPCGACGQPYCPACGLCRCQQQDQQDVTCQRCNMKVMAHRLTDGICDDCA